MYFVVDRPRFQKMIAIVRDDRAKHTQGSGGPYLRLEAGNNLIKLTGLEAEVEFKATVYRPGVLFLRVTAFRTLLPTFKGTKAMEFQLDERGLLFGDIRMRFDSGNMLFYEDPKTAPAHHPGDRQRAQGLFDITREAAIDRVKAAKEELLAAQQALGEIVAESRTVREALLDSIKQPPKGKPKKSSKRRRP